MASPENRAMRKVFGSTPTPFPVAWSATLEKCGRSGPTDCTSPLCIALSIGGRTTGKPLPVPLSNRERTLSNLQCVRSFLLRAQLRCVGEANSRCPTEEGPENWGVGRGARVQASRIRRVLVGKSRKQLCDRRVREVLRGQEFDRSKKELRMRLSSETLDQRMETYRPKGDLGLALPTV